MTRIFRGNWSPLYDSETVIASRYRSSWEGSLSIHDQVINALTCTPLVWVVVFLLLLTFSDWHHAQMMAVVVEWLLMVALRRVHSNHEVTPRGLVAFRSDMLRVTWMRDRRVTGKWSSLFSLEARFKVRSHVWGKRIRASLLLAGGVRGSPWSNLQIEWWLALTRTHNGACSHPLGAASIGSQISHWCPLIHRALLRELRSLEGALWRIVH